MVLSKSARFFFLLSFALFCSSCQYEEPVNPSDDSENISVVGDMASPYSVSLDDAVDYLNGFLGASNVETKSVPYTVDTLKVSDILPSIPTRSSESDFEDLVYILNYTDGSCAILGADQRIDPLIAYTPNGGFSVDDLVIAADSTIKTGLTLEEIYDEAADDYLIGNSGDFDPAVFITEYLLYSVNNPSQSSVIYDDEKTLYTDVIPPMLITKWHQGRPFNDLCTYSGGYRPLGCGPVAALQVIAYDSTARLDVHFGVEDIYWKDLVIPRYFDEEHDAASELSYYKEKYTDPEYLLRSAAIAKVARKIAEGAKSKFNYFGTGQTFTYPKSLCHYMCDLNIAASYSGYRDNNVLNSLKNSKPVIVSGLAKKTLVGHFWVIDGLKQISMVEFGTGREFVKNYFHCNWGWGGYKDGYFTSDLFNPDRPALAERMNTDKESHYAIMMNTIIYK